jgi:soluble lytic murein transglycosylase
MSHLILLLALLVPIQLNVQDKSIPAAGTEELLLQAAANIRLGYSAPARAILTGLVVPPEHPEWEAARKLLMSRALLLEGDGKTAATLCETLIGLDRPGLSRLARYHLALALHQDGRPAAALPHFDELWRVADDGALGPKLCRAGFDSALASGDGKQTSLWLKRLGRCKGVDNSEVLEAKVLRAAAEAESADKECRELYTRWPCAKLPDPCHIDELAKDLKSHEQFDRAVRLFSCWGYVEAAAIFEKCLAEPAWSRHHNRCHFFLAEIHSRKLRDDRAKALQHYRHVYKHGGGAKHSALYQMGRCKMNLEKYDEAVAIFEDYIDRYPDGAHAERCYYYLGWLPYDHDQLDAAMPGFDRYLNRYRKGELRTYILWFKAWSLYRLQRYKEAAKVFAVLSKYGNDIVAGKAYYWLGQIAAHQEQPKRAREWFEKSMERYPLSYYGMLSWHRLHELGDAKDNPLFLHETAGPQRPLPSQLGPLVQKRLETSLQPAMDAVLVGEMRAARAWFEPHRKSFERAVGANNIEAHYWLFSILEEPASMRTWGSKHKRQRGKVPTDQNRAGWTFAYPQAYLRLIEVQAEHTGLPPWFFYSIMRQESRYRRGVISWADAVGLLQVIPPTGKRTAERLGIPFDRFNLSDPAVNLRLGTSYLGFLAKDFHNQLTLVAASYNAGPDPIRTFVRDNREGGWDHIIEEIAYNEARNYCRKVTGHVLKYLATYAPLAERQLVFPLLFPSEANLDIGESVDY